MTKAEALATAIMQGARAQAVAEALDEMAVTIHEYADGLRKEAEKAREASKSIEGVRRLLLEIEATKRRRDAVRIAERLFNGGMIEDQRRHG